MVSRKDALRLILTLAALIAVVAYLGSHYRAKIEWIGQWFLEKFGPAGMAAGSFLSDAFHFPIPPQFYLLTAVITEAPALPTLVAICAGALIGDGVAFLLGKYFARAGKAWKWMGTKPGAAIASEVNRRRYHAVLATTITPISYSWLCNVLGFYGAPARILILILPLRAIRIVLFYFAFQAGWGLSG